MSPDALRELFHADPPTNFPPRRLDDLLIVGTGRCALDDLSSIDHRGEVMAVKQIGMFLPRLDHWVSCHDEFWPAWRLARHYQRGTMGEYLTHALQGQIADVKWPINGRFAFTSGLMAPIIGKWMGYRSIVLAGMPGDASGHFYPEPPRPDGTVGDYGSEYDKSAWLWLRDNFFEGRVRSLSGNTREWLG